MPLAALLIAGDDEGPRLLGASPVEYQLRRARAAGAMHAVVFVERVGAALLASVDRLRSEGMSVDIARTVADAADLVHPDEGVLMLAPGVIVAHDRLQRLAQSEGMCLLCVRDEPANQRFELIDPTARWIGFGRIDGGLLRRTAATLGDWDFASTLLRRAVQEGAHRMTLTPDEADRDLLVVEGSIGAQNAGRSLIAATDVESAGWATHWLLRPAARLLARIAGEAGIEAKWVTLAGFAAFGMAGVSALFGWIVASLVLLLIGQLCDLGGSLEARAGAGATPWERLRYPVRALAAAVVVVAMGTTLMLRTGQWGCAVLAVANIAATWLAAPIARDDAQFSRWRGDPSGHAIIGLVGFAFGSPIAALAVAAGHAALSLVAAVGKLKTRLASF